YGASREDLAKIAVKNHHNGTLAPKSMLKREITVDDVLKARIISWPFGLYDCAAQSDGAAAAIITRRELAKSFRKDFILVRGIGIALSPNPQEDPSFDFLRWKATEMAAKQVYAQAGITNPRKQIQVAQVHDCFTLTELLAYEDLGFCEKGSAKEHIASGTFELGGELPVNTDGGLKTFGHPTGATGVRMIYENYKQLQGKAGPRQVKNATVALSHNIGGAPHACGICVVATPYRVRAASLIQGIAAALPRPAAAGRTGPYGSPHVCMVSSARERREAPGHVRGPLPGARPHGRRDPRRRAVHEPASGGSARTS